MTLGCPKNEADSDSLARRLVAAGHRVAPLERAEVVVVNTCGFIDAAKEESIGSILGVCAAAHARGARVAAVGCLVERHRAELTRELPEVDLWCGFEWDPLARLLDEVARERVADPAPRRLRTRLPADSASGGGGVLPDPVESLQEPAGGRREPRPVSAYVKVSDGCDRRCSFCAIPLIKGRYELVPPAAVVAAARAALSRGARELVLVGQDTSRYSVAGWGGLERLLAALAALEPAPAWLRLLYLQPENVDERLLGSLAAHAVPYLDVPFQHASRRILKAMGRQGDGEAHLALLERARLILPGVAVRSTFIAGFPGETEADFDELLAFVREAGLAVGGVFVFDPQEGTPAATLPGRPPAEVAAGRAAALAAAIERAAAPFWEAQVGRRVEVLVERGCRAGGEALGRVAAQAPDIDGRTYVSGGRMRRGDLVEAMVTQTLGFDLAAAAAPRATAGVAAVRRLKESR